MKDSIRKEVLKKRDSLTKEEIIEKSKIIKQKLFSLDEYKKAKTICFYVSFGSEVDTFEMIKDSLKDKTVCVPVINEDDILLSTIKDIENLDKKDKYGILEPSKIIPIKKEDVDIMIVPGVAFDKNGHRIGYGKGYYDRFLKEFSGMKIAIAFDLQIVEDIITKGHDIQMDKVVTET